MNEYIIELLSLIITVAVLVVCIVCFIIIFLVCCLPNQMIPCPNARMRRRDTQRQCEEEDEEMGGTKERDLFEVPPPAYKNASQYQNVDLEHTEVVRMKSVYRLSSHTEPETASLPPDYTLTRGDDVTSERVSKNGVGPQEMEVVGGQLPPTYSTAQMELMARRLAIEIGIQSEFTTEDAID